jgi:hypothetical protein
MEFQSSSGSFSTQPAVGTSLFWDIFWQATISPDLSNSAAFIECVPTSSARINFVLIFGMSRAALKFKLICL